MQIRTSTRSQHAHAGIGHVPCCHPASNTADSDEANTRGHWGMVRPAYLQAAVCRQVPQHLPPGLHACIRPGTRVQGPATTAQTPWPQTHAPAKIDGSLAKIGAPRNAAHATGPKRARAAGGRSRRHQLIFISFTCSAG